MYGRVKDHSRHQAFASFRSAWTSRSDPPTSLIFLAAFVMEVLRPECDDDPANPSLPTQPLKRNWTLLDRVTASDDRFLSTTTNASGATRPFPTS